MSQSILITGGAGYIGGTLVAEFISRTNSPIKDAEIFAAVRSKEHVQALSNLKGVTVLLVDLLDAEGVNAAVLDNKIDIVINAAPSFVPDQARNLIDALGERKRVSGGDVWFMQSSVTTVFSKEGGWPYGDVKDSDDDIFEKEKKIASSNPVHDTNVMIVEKGKKLGVKIINMVVSVIYGRGDGEVRKLSATMPSQINAAIKNELVYRFEKDGSPCSAHISDLKELYALIVENILQHKDIPHTENGYYFGFAHRLPWYKMTDRLATALNALGMVKSAEPQIWPSDEKAAKDMGLPIHFIRMMAGTVSGDLIAEKGYKLGWKPNWDESKFLDSMDQEIEDVQKYDTVKANLFEALNK